jgi:hypothetical protein
MRTYYFVGGPTTGHAEAFFRRLQAAGGSPSGWLIYPHACGDGKALHIVRAESDDSINAHLAQFGDIYEATLPIELADAAGPFSQAAQHAQHSLGCLDTDGRLASTAPDAVRDDSDGGRQ